MHAIPPGTCRTLGPFVFAVALLGPGLAVVHATSGASFRGLGDLSGGDVLSEGNAVSENGIFVAGRSASSGGSEACFYSALDGLVGLGDLAGGKFVSQAQDTSGNGRVIVGIS